MRKERESREKKRGKVRIHRQSRVQGSSAPEQCSARTRRLISTDSSLPLVLWTRLLSSSRWTIFLFTQCLPACLSLPRTHSAKALQRLPLNQIHHCTILITDPILSSALQHTVCFVYDCGGCGGGWVNIRSNTRAVLKTNDYYTHFPLHLRLSLPLHSISFCPVHLLPTLFQQEHFACQPVLSPTLTAQRW